MLSLMRKKAGSWIIKVILFIIVLVFIFWGFGSFRNRQTNQVADINGTIITYEAYRQVYDRLLEQYRQIYGAKLDDKTIKMLHLDEAALNQMVQRILMLQEAERLGIEATPSEVTAAIHDIPAFQNNGVFDFARYNGVLAQNNISAEAFEKDQKEGLIIERLRDAALDGVTISEADARQWYDWQNTQINLDYILFSPNRYKDIPATDEEIAAYFKDHQDTYLTDPQVKVQYLFFDPHAQVAKVQISDAQIERYYNSHTDEFHSEKTVHARHILFKLDPDADEATIEKQHKKALEVYEMAKKGKTSFAELAKKYSEGPSRSNGGDLGTFGRDSMVKPFADKAFTMKPGEISEPIRTQFGWHIIKVEEVNPETTISLDGAREEIRKKLIDQKSLELALEKAELVYDSLFDGDDLSKVKTDDQVTMGTTDFFSSKNPPKIGNGPSQKFADAALALDKMAISDILQLDNGYYILQVTDRIESAVPPIDSVKERVRADVIQMKQGEQAKKDAQAAQTALNGGKTLEEVAAADKMKVEETGFFGRSGAIPKIGYEPDISKTAYALTVAHPLAQEASATQAGAWVVFKLKERKAPDSKEFDSDKEDIIARLTEQKKQKVLSTWIEDLKSRGNVKINYDLIR